MGATLGKLWLELIWPSRRAWCGIAAVWVVVLGVNVQMNATAPARPAAQSGAEMARAVAEQQRVLAELLPPLSPPQAQVIRPKPGPRSDRALQNMFAHVATGVWGSRELVLQVFRISATRGTVSSELGLRSDESLLTSAPTV